MLCVKTDAISLKMINGTFSCHHGLINIVKSIYMVCVEKMTFMSKSFFKNDPSVDISAHGKSV